MAQTPNWEFYRFSTVGLALLEVVDEMVRNGSLSAELANVVMARYDDAIGDALRKRVQARCSFTARCSTFNLVDEVYRFTLKNVKFKMENAEVVQVPSMKVIAVKNTTPDEDGGDDGGKRKREKTDEGTPTGKSKKGKKRA